MIPPRLRSSQGTGRLPERTDRMFLSPGVKPLTDSATWRSSTTYAGRWSRPFPPTIFGADRHTGLLGPRRCIVDLPPLHMCRTEQGSGRNPQFACPPADRTPPTSSESQHRSPPPYAPSRHSSSCCDTTKRRTTAGPMFSTLRQAAQKRGINQRYLPTSFESGPLFRANRVETVVVFLDVDLASSEAFVKDVFRSGDRRGTGVPEGRDPLMWPRCRTTLVMIQTIPTQNAIMSTESGGPARAERPPTRTTEPFVGRDNFSV